jgi:hypothetical protein
MVSHLKEEEKNGDSIVDAMDAMSLNTYKQQKHNNSINS